MDIKNIVLTGASRGIGESIARKLAKNGFNVFGFARNIDRLDSLVKKGNDRIFAYQVDVTEPDQIQKAYEEIETNYGPIDVLINNAGIYQGIEFYKQGIDRISKIIDINLKGTLFCTRLVLPYMMERKKGRIINISSVSGTRGIPLEVAYGASKHGMIGMADALAQEVKPYGIIIATICPGAVDTPLWHGDSPYQGDINEVMKPEEIAECVFYLLNQSDRTIYKRIILFPRNEWH